MIDEVIPSGARNPIHAGGSRLVLVYSEFRLWGNQFVRDDMQ
jgi:hypothetical protein